MAKTLLHHDGLRDLNPFDRYTAYGAQVTAHKAALSIFFELEERLPSKLRDAADKFAIVGLFTAIARILARFDDPRQADEIAAAIGPCMQNELRYWREFAAKASRRPLN